VTAQSGLQRVGAFGGCLLAQPDEDAPVVEHDVAAFNGSLRQAADVRHSGGEFGESLGFGQAVRGVHTGGKKTLSTTKPISRG
jgi:hypothetical protein